MLNKYFSKISSGNMQYFHNKLYTFEKMHEFFDKYAIKNNLQNKMHISCSLIARKIIILITCVMWS